jgi:hypothetical protein
MSRSTREAEPIHVSHTSVLLAAIGFLALGIGESLLCWAPTGTRFEYVLLTLGTLNLAAALINHLDHHRPRFGLAALVFYNLGIIAAAAVWIPYAIDPSLSGTQTWSQFSYVAWGAAWTLGSIGTFVVMARKEARLEHGDKSAETEIHATFFQLTALAVGMLIYGISFFQLATERTNQFDAALAVIGPALIAAAVIAHVEHLTLRIGLPAVVITALSASLWAVKNLSREVDSWMENPDLARFFVYGVQGAIFFLGAIACLLVLSHKKTWKVEQQNL